MRDDAPTCLPDPEVRFGAYRVLPFNGRGAAFVIIDTRRPAGDQRVRFAPSLRAAVRQAERLASEVA